MLRHALPIAAAVLALLIAAVLGANASAWSPAFAGLACAGFTVLCCTAFGWMLARRLRRGYEQSIEETMRALDAVREGSATKVPLVGPSDMQALMRKVNLATSAVEERKRQSQANLMSLEVAFDRIHSVLHSLSEGVIVIDGLREIVIANPAARSRLRNDDRMIEGRPLVELLDGELCDRVAQGLDALPGAADGRILLTAVTDGERRYDVSIVRVRSNRDDQDFGTVVVLVDVTATHEMARLKDRFLSSVSHELRTPLTNICSFAELLDQQLREGAVHECGEFATIIQTEGRRLTALVDDVLDYNALETGASPGDDVEVDLVEVVRTSCQHARPLAAEKLVQFEAREAEGALTVRGDRVHLIKVMEKLLDNAIKFTPGGGTVRVELRALDGAVQVEVSDSGIGVPKEHREAIFEKFTQIGDTLTGKPPGAGLGLAIARRIVDRAGGRVWCTDSQLGGACLVISLPLVASVGVGV